MGLNSDCSFDLSTDLFQIRIARGLSFRETAGQLVNVAWNNVHVHMEDFLGRGSTVRLADIDPVSIRGLHYPSHNLGYGNEDPTYLFGRHLNHASIVLLRNN